ncbi:MAG TPA: hypothetical protein VER83_02530, partial [Candidatus Nanopelagicales bacterium]|nr:hypothetical protein [Candidatus Nanopelagicales bacterium]
MVRVGDERARVAAGEAVLWPADVPHAAWTELSEMRAIVVELAGPDDAYQRGILDGRPLAIGAGDAEAKAAAVPAERADGELSASPADAARAAAEGEPL